MPPSKRTTAPQQREDEVPEWDMPATEGDPSIAAGREVEEAKLIEGIVESDVLQDLMTWCVEYAQNHAADTADAMAAEVRRILAGEDAASVLAESKPLAGKDFLDKPFLVHSFTLNPTDFTEGWPFYASMECSIPGRGEAFVLNCGGPKVIAALRRLDELGEYPYPVKVRGKETKAGRTVLQLVAAGA